jgi:hypothetical protein
MNNQHDTTTDLGRNGFVTDATKIIDKKKLF